MRVLRGILGGAAVLLAAAPALAGVGYSVIIESPPPVPDAPTLVRGEVAVLARAEGGVGDAGFAAYHVHPSGDPWVEQDRVVLQPLEGGRFGSTEPWSTGALPNGRYELEVRVWGEVPEYHADRPGTFARALLSTIVDNPPLAPRVRALTSVRAVRLKWRDVPTASREDFIGYRVWSVRARRCPAAPGAYDLVTETRGTDWAQLGAQPGHVCFRASSVRYSEATGMIESSMSSPIHILVRRRAPAAVLSGPAAPPRSASAAHGDEGPPKLGKFEEALPYETESEVVVADPGETAVSDKLPGSGRDLVNRLAVGLLLLTMAVHLRRFLWQPSPARRRTR
jgi:hypothetical protein